MKTTFIDRAFWFCMIAGAVWLGMGMLAIAGRGYRDKLLHGLERQIQEITTISPVD